MVMDRETSWASSSSYQTTPRLQGHCQTRTKTKYELPQRVLKSLLWKANTLLSDLIGIRLSCRHWLNLKAISTLRRRIMWTRQRRAWRQWLKVEWVVHPVKNLHTLFLGHEITLTWFNAWFLNTFRWFSTRTAWIRGWLMRTSLRACISLPYHCTKIVR